MIDVSVIVPIYNAEKYIEKCMESLFSQTIDSTRFEIIAINDGSSDSSIKIISELKNKHPNLVIVNTKNQGAAEARNKGLDIAKGEYVGFVDADDWVEPNMFEVLFTKAKKYDADIVFCNILKNESEKMPAYLETGLYTNEQIAEYIYPRLISASKSNGNTLRGSVCCKIFKKSMIDKKHIHFLKDLIYNEDGLFCIEATLAAKTYVYLGEYYLYHNRVNENSITKRYITDLWNRQKVMIDILSEIVGEQEYSFENQISKKALDIAIYSMENEIKKKAPHGLITRLKHIHDIMLDSDLQCKLSKIEFEDLKKIDYFYAKAVKLKIPLMAYLIAKYRFRNNKYF